MFLECIIYLRASSQNFVENHQFNVILLYFNQFYTITCSISPTCPPLASTLKIFRFYFLDFFCFHHNVLDFVDLYVLKFFHDFFLQKIHN